MQDYRRRIAPIPPAASDYIVMAVLKNEQLLIRSGIHLLHAYGDVGAENSLYKSRELDAQLYRLAIESSQQHNTAPSRYDFRPQRSSMNFDAYMMETASNDPNVSDSDDISIYEPPAKANATTKKERTATPSIEREFPNGSACSGDNYDLTVPELDYSDVSEIEIQRLRMETLKSEKRMFEKWTEMAAAQIKTLESMMSMQKEFLQQVTKIVKGVVPTQQPRRTSSNRHDRGQAHGQEIFGFEIF
ncbi:hypothetical protein OSTOST_08958 [Ostertagia ostertagi]